MANRKAPPKDVELKAPLWVVTWGDMISLLLTFFILIFTFSAVDQDKMRRVQGALRGGFGALTPKATRSNPNVVATTVTPQDKTALDGAAAPSARPADEEDALKTLVQGRDFDVPVDFHKAPDGVRIRLESDEAFQLGTPKLRRKARELALEIGRYFVSMPVRLVVEAHTDDRTFEDMRYASAVALTEDMALNVAQMLVVEGGWPPARVGVAAYGAMRPLNDNGSPADRRRNRRVEILVIREEGK